MSVFSPNCKDKIQIKNFNHTLINLNYLPDVFADFFDEKITAIVESVKWGSK